MLKLFRLRFRHNFVFSESVVTLPIKIPRSTLYLLSPQDNCLPLERGSAPPPSSPECILDFALISFTFFFHWQKLYVYILETKLLYDQCLINLKYDLQRWKLNLVSLVNRDDCNMESRRSKKMVWYENNPKVFYPFRTSTIGRRFETSQERFAGGLEPAVGARPYRCLALLKGSYFPPGEETLL